jgi:hypothetical protein
MALVFYPENHEYISLDTEDPIDWISVTTVTGAFKQPFSDKQAEKSSKNRKSKWYGMTPDEVRVAWRNEAKRATDLGTWYHDQREQDLCELLSIERGGITVPVRRPIIVDGVKHAPDQKLEDGVYPEHLVYLKSVGVCGQSDVVEVVNGMVNITDFKTNKELKKEGYRNWEGITQKMQPPLSHLDDCHMSHYALQLSIYMFMILKHNPQLRAGKLIIHHVIFEEAGRDKFDNPITLRNEQGDPVVKGVIPYELPYLKSEVLTLLTYVKNNRDKVKRK